MAIGYTHMFGCYIIVVVQGLYDHNGNWQYKLVFYMIKSYDYV